MSGFDWAGDGAGADGSRATVLIVEDERQLADLFADWLAEEYAVRPAYSGTEALERLDDAVDVVLLDRRMPGMSGDDVLAAIREGPHDPRVALVTAVTPDFDILPLEFDAYLTKPVSADELRETVDELVARNDLDSRLQQYHSLLSKKSKLESEKTAGALETNVKYNAIVRELEALRVELDDELADLAGTPTEDPDRHPGWRQLLDGGAIVAVAVALVGIYLAVPGFADASTPDGPAEWIVASFVHLGPSHLAGNVLGYLVVAFFTYALCVRLRAVRWFYLTAPVLILAVAFLAPLTSHELHLLLWPERPVVTWGFSAVVAGFIGYAFLTLLLVFRSFHDPRSVFFIGVFVAAASVTTVLGVVGHPLVILGAAVVVGSLAAVVVSLRRGSSDLSGSPDSLLRRGSLIVAAAVVFSTFGLSLFPVIQVDNAAGLDIIGHLVGVVLGFLIAFVTAFVVDLFPLNEGPAGAP